MAAAPPGPGPRPCPATIPALGPGGGGAHPASRIGSLRRAPGPARGPLAQPGAARSLWWLRCTHLVALPKIGSKLK